MTHEKLQNVKKKKRHDGFTMDVVQVKCETDQIKHLNFINNEDLKTYHDTYVKLNAIHNMDTISYYITENDLNKICNDKINHIRLKLENSHHKSHSKKQDKQETKCEALNDELESLLAKLNDDNEFEDNEEINFDILHHKNIYYNSDDTGEYDTFVLWDEDGIISYTGMEKKMVSTFVLIEKQFICKMVNYELNNGANALFLIYSKQWPTYTYPVYVVIHEYKFTTKKFIMIFNTVIDLVVK